MRLKEIKTDTEHYFIDVLGRKQGEYKRYYENNQLELHCFYKDDLIIGEYKSYDDNGKIERHYFYDQDNKDITTQVEALAKNIKNLTEEEKFLIKLTFGIPLCD